MKEIKHFLFKKSKNHPVFITDFTKLSKTAIKRIHAKPLDCIISVKIIDLNVMNIDLLSIFVQHFSSMSSKCKTIE